MPTFTRSNIDWAVTGSDHSFIRTATLITDSGQMGAWLELEAEGTSDVIADNVPVRYTTSDNRQGVLSLGRIHNLVMTAGVTVWVQMVGNAWQVSSAPSTGAVNTLSLIHI